MMRTVQLQIVEGDSPDSKFQTVPHLHEPVSDLDLCDVLSRLYRRLTELIVIVPSRSNHRLSCRRRIIDCLVDVRADIEPQKRLSPRTKPLQMTKSPQIELFEISHTNGNFYFTPIPCTRKRDSAVVEGYIEGTLVMSDEGWRRSAPSKSPHLVSSV